MIKNVHFNVDIYSVPEVTDTFLRLTDNRN